MREAVGREPFANVALLLSGGSSITVATGIANIHARTGWPCRQGRDPAGLPMAEWRELATALPDW